MNVQLSQNKELMPYEFDLDNNAAKATRFVRKMKAQ